MAEYIEREAIIKAFVNGEADVIDDYGDGCDFGFSLDNIREILNAIPAAEVEPVKRGRWIHPEDYIVSNGFLCSECGYEEPSHRPINPRPGGSCIADNDGNFYYPPETERCPKCNAKMYVGTDNG